MTEVIKLDLLPYNTSDHYPLITQLVASLDSKETMKEKPGFTRTNWEKVDKDEYQQILKAKLEKISFEQNHEHIDTHIGCISWHSCLFCHIPMLFLSVK